MKLKDKIQSIAIKQSGSKDKSDYVVYRETPVRLPNYGELSMYSMQAGGREIAVNFMAPNRSMICYSSLVKDAFIDSHSFDKYKGLKYYYEPLTEQVENAILKAIK